MTPVVHRLTRDQLRGEFIPAERLYRTKDNRLVFMEDEAAAFLFCIPGRPIPMKDAIRYGLVVVVEDPPEAKEVTEVETKEVLPEAIKRAPARSSYRRH